MEKVGKRKFGIFIRALHKEAGGTQFGFVDDLFKTLGIKVGTLDAFETLLKNWIAGKNQGFKEYFKRKEINQKHCNDFNAFLDERIGIRFTNVQSSLNNYCDEYILINYETDKQDVFFKSVLNQFKEIVGYPYEQSVALGVRNYNSNDENKSALQIGTPSEQMKKVFKLAIYDCKLITILNLCPSATQQANTFLETIQSEIEHNDYFKEYRHDEIYQKIISFAYFVDHYNRALNTRDHSTISMMSALKIEINYLWKKIITLYSEICDDSTSFASKPPI